MDNERPYLKVRNQPVTIKLTNRQKNLVKLIDSKTDINDYKAWSEVRKNIVRKYSI
jgi:hypothetical protein